MNVYSPAPVPAGVNGEKLRLAGRVGDLVAAQKLLTDRVEVWVLHVRIDAQSIAVPNVYLSTNERLTVSGIDAREPHGES